MTQLERRGGAGIDVLRTQLAPNATDEELAYFAQVARHLELDPWAGHIVLIGRYDKEAGGKVHRPQLTVAGRRFIAQRTGRLEGVDGPYWCGPDRNDSGGHDWLEIWDDDDRYPYGARCLVHVAGWTVPANGTVRWQEFAQYVDAGRTRLMPTWAAMPAHMLGKTAESLALRRGFAEVAAAVHLLEGDDDDTTLIAEAAAEVAAPSLAAPARDRPAVSAARPARPRIQARNDSPPPEYYDNLPEAVAHHPADSYRYDPADTGPGARFTE